MIRDMNIAFRTLHEVLIAARNMAFANPGTPALLSIVDSIEAIPVWTADPTIDRAEDIICVLDFPGMAMFGTLRTWMLEH